MTGSGHFTRIDLFEAKELITRKLGDQKAEKYFDILNSYFSKKLTRSEFIKLCIVTLGRENIKLHNWFIDCILKNAAFSKTPPPATPSKQDSSANEKLVNENPTSCQSGRTPLQTGLQWKPQPMKCQEQRGATELHSLGSTSVEDEEEVKEIAGSPGICSQRPLTAPYGVQFRANGSHNRASVLSLTYDHLQTCYSTQVLPDTHTLKARLEQKLAPQGLKVSLDCANLVNVGLDMYLRSLIRPCLDLAKSVDQTVPSMNERMQSVGYVENPSMNGTMQHVGYVQNPSINRTMQPVGNAQNPSMNRTMQPVGYSQNPKSYIYVSSVDLRAAMELSLLRKNCPKQLETLALHQEW